jgi:flotillin
VLGIILLIVLFPRYHKVPPNVALIISGKIRRDYKVKDADGNLVVKRFGYRIVRGGATFVIPFFERVDRLNLGLMQVDIKTTQPVPSQEYISVVVDGVANIKIGSDDVSIATAAEQFLNWNQADIATIAQQVLEGNMREIIGRMTISDLVQSRDKFAAETSKAAASDMRNMGLEIVNITIQNFSDDDKVVETMATRNIQEKMRDAAIAKAEAERDTQIRSAEARQQGHKAEVEAQALIAEQSKTLALKKAEYKILEDRSRADADIAYDVQKEVARKEFEAERAAAEMVRLQRETDLSRQQVQVQREKLNVEIREKANAERDARIARAEAERAERQAIADAEFYQAQRQAEAILLKGKAEAQALELKAEAMQNYGQAAMLEMVVDRMPAIAKAIGEPLAKTDKIILFGEGAATGLTRDMTGSMLQTFEAMKASVGLDVPKLIRDVTSGGLVGRAPKDGAPTGEATPS